MKRLTLRGIDKELERKIRGLARKDGISLSEAALRLIREGDRTSRWDEEADVVGSSLDRFFGTWTDEECREFMTALKDLDSFGESREK